jgi:hypothetical protein
VDRGRASRTRLVALLEGKQARKLRAELSPRTFRNVAGEFSATGGYGRATLISDRVLAVYSCDRAIRLSRAVASRRTGPRVPVDGCR